MSRRTVLTALQTLAVLGAILCVARYASANLCPECDDVANCDCNCKQNRCLASYVKDDVLDACYYFTLPSCSGPFDDPKSKKVYVLNGANSTCTFSDSVMDIRGGINCGRECAGCAKTGGFGAGDCQAGAEIIAESVKVKKCISS